MSETNCEWPQKRNAEVTRDKLLQAALSEFCEKGLNGSRTAAIAASAGCNIRMLYHYFGNKEGIYLAALERVYADLRESEEKLDLLDLEPDKAMVVLVQFTFDYMLEHQEFIKMIGLENIQQGRFLLQSEAVPSGAVPLVDGIKKLLRRGKREGYFRKSVDPVQLYISILSLSYVHISNQHTLSITFSHDITDDTWLAARRRHVCDMVMSYLSVPEKNSHRK